MPRINPRWEDEVWPIDAGITDNKHCFYRHEKYNICHHPDNNKDDNWWHCLSEEQCPLSLQKEKYSKNKYIFLYTTDHGALPNIITGRRDEIYNYAKQIDLTEGFTYKDYTMPNESVHVPKVVYYEIAVVVEKGPKLINNMDIASRYIKNQEG